MAIFSQLSQQDIESQFTHYARFAGLVPCYYADDDSARLAVRNWWPDWLLTAATSLYAMFIFCVSLVDDDYDPAWPIVITGEIEAMKQEG